MTSYKAPEAIHDFLDYLDFNVDNINSNILENTMPIVKCDEFNAECAVNDDCEYNLNDDTGEESYICHSCLWLYG